ncbi:hypothetical protein ACFOHW_20015 [Paenibacillus abyssi]|uniref:Uncharacterized protein n=1 Tax=Paenibacillus abyssi TaxID=1340531 RepID=A0A917FYX8_9BACL|nr:hypothetical protein GCM10010916_34460 [Paenibacillus abyssi]
MEIVDNNLDSETIKLSRYNLATNQTEEGIRSLGLEQLGADAVNSALIEGNLAYILQ